MAQAYRHLAGWFEYLNDDCDYLRWSQYFIETLKRLGAGNNGLELGCGSGAFCRLLSKAGYFMSGADISSEMLSEAERLAREEGLRIPFFQTDVRRPRLPGQYDFILAPNDVYNYIPPKELGPAFRQAAKLLSKGGILHFDVSSPYKFYTKVADTVSADDRDDVVYLSFNKREGDRVQMDVTLFVRRKDGAFDRFDELHTQYIHREEAVTESLQSAGLRVLSVEGDLGENKEKSDRLNFICKKD